MKRLAFGCADDVLADLGREARMRAQRVDVIRVRDESHIEYEIGFEGDAELVAERDELDRQLIGPSRGRETGEQPLA